MLSDYILVLLTTGQRFSLWYTSLSV